MDYLVQRYKVYWSLFLLAYLLSVKENCYIQVNKAVKLFLQE